MPREKSTKTTDVKKVSTRLKNTEQVRNRKSSAVGFGSSVATYEPYKRLSTEQLRELIMTTIWAETCIDTIVDEVIKYPLYTSVGEDSNRNKQIDGFLSYPSMKEPHFMIRKQYLKDMLRWGNGACIIEYKKNVPNQLVVTPGYTLRVTDAEPHTYKLLQIGSSQVFKQDKNGKDLEFSQRELMHFCIDKDSDSTLGSSNLERAYEEILADKESAKRVVEFVKRGFYKPSFITFKKGVSVSKTEIQDFIEYLNSLINEGVKVLGVNKEADLKEIPFWNASDIIEMQRWLGLKIASVFKVPPFMLNLVQDVGSLNAREQKARFLENVVMPILEYEAFLYTNVLVRQGYKDLDTIITSSVLGTRLNYDKARIANLLVGQGSGGILTVDEARKLFFNLDAKPVVPEVK